MTCFTAGIDPCEELVCHHAISERWAYNSGERKRVTGVVPRDLGTTTLLGALERVSVPMTIGGVFGDSPTNRMLLSSCLLTGKYQ